MKFIYPAVFHFEEDSYWVEFPDLPGCFSDGDTPEEALSNAQESMALYLEPDADSAPDYPQPSNINSIDKPDSGFVSFVTADVDLSKSGKCVRKNLTIPEWLNNRATQKGINFSQVLQEALIKQCY